MPGPGIPQDGERGRRANEQLDTAWGGQRGPHRVPWVRREAEGVPARERPPVLRLHGILWLEGRGCVTGRGEAGKAKKDPECHQRFGPHGHREPPRRERPGSDSNLAAPWPVEWNWGTKQR